jgi:hypothetical protein
MGHKWIIDVLADLKSFASKNDLQMLALQLDETALIASAEIEMMSEKLPPLTRGDSSGTRQIFAIAGAGRRA